VDDDTFDESPGDQTPGPFPDDGRNDGTGDPFSGVPIFGDLTRMLRSQGPVGWDAARQLALSVATDGVAEGNVDPLERIRFEQLAHVAELHVAATTGLTTSFRGLGVTVLPVTRSQWAATSLDTWRPMFERLSGALTSSAPLEVDPDDPMGFMAPLMAMIAPMMLGMVAGSMVGHLARRSFGQYDLPVPRAASDELMVVPANLDEFAEGWSIPADDLRMWVCIQEVATHTILRLDHVRGAVEDFLTAYAEGFEPDPGALETKLGSFDITDANDPAGLQKVFGDPELVLGAIQSDAQRALLPRFEALIATIVGYVDHTVDTIAATLLGNGPMIAEAVRRRRVEATDADRFVERLFGLELTQATYDRGRAFVDGIVDRSGADALARLWTSPETLPTPAEIDAPGLWLARLEFVD